MHVTGHGTGSTHCRTTGYRPDGNDQLIWVACHTATGLGIDAQFTVSYHEGDGMFGVPHYPNAPRAYVLTDAQGAAVDSPYVQHDSAGYDNVVTRLDVGSYRVRLTGLASSGGHVQAGAYRPNGDGRRCKVANWSSDGTDELVDVRCFDGAGAPADARFVMSYAG